MSRIRIAPITAGAYRAPAEDDQRRMVRVLAFVQAAEHDLAWAHPVDGVTAHVDLIGKKVIRVTDAFQLPVPTESGDYDDPAVRGPERLSSEAMAARSGDASHGRVWRVLSTERVNRFGRHDRVHAAPGAAPGPARQDSPLALRAGFAARALWVTRYDPAQRYPVGDAGDAGHQDGLHAQADRVL